MISGLWRGLQHIRQSETHPQRDICAKQNFYDFYKALLSEHRKIAVRDRERRVRIFYEAFMFFFSRKSKEDYRNSQKLKPLCFAKKSVLSEANLEMHFQMGKLLSHRRESTLPGKTHYYQKLGPHIVGFLNLLTGFNRVYLMDETKTEVRRKISSLVLSCLTHFVDTYLSKDVKLLNVYFDSAG